MISSSYLLLIVVTFAIGGLATAYVNGQLKKYSKVAASNGLTGAQAAKGMLAYYGVNNVPVKPGGNGQDFFDPRSNSITLSPQAYNVSTITAMATACHEVGHALQYASDYKPMKIRGALVPAVNFCSNSWVVILLIGILLNFAGLVTLAIIMYAVAVLFQIVTLPVEFNASNRALAYLKQVYLPEQEISGARSVLRACAFTYVAAALISVLQLLYLLGQQQKQ